MRLKYSSIIKDYFVCPNSITFSSGGKKEELDVIIRIGNKILLGEAKCIVYSTDPMDYFNYLKSLKHGIEQIKRKVRFVITNIQDFINIFPDIKIREIKDIEIIPFVITNRSLGAGFIIEEIPIVDQLILNKYFDDGRWEKFGIIDKEGKKTVGETELFYQTEEEAIKNLREYILNPPQINFYKKFLKPVRYPVAVRLQEDDKKTLILRLEVEIPLPEGKF
jgi:hypothetical protein